MTLKVAVIGECMIELTENNRSIKRGFGGDTLNTAVYLKRANPELTVSYVTALGTDAMSQQMVDSWSSEGVDTHLVQRMSDKLPGLYMIETDAHGERKFHYWRNDAAARFWLQTTQADEICRELAGFDYIYLSGISLAILSAADRTALIARIAECRAQGVKVAFDNNYRPRLWESTAAAQEAYRAMLTQTDLAFLTLDDEFALWGDTEVSQTLARTQALGVAEIVVKRGSEACLIVSGQNQCEVDALRIDPTHIIDTTAAGDSFSAGYLSRRLAGLPQESAASYAHLLAGTVIQHRGAVIPASAMPVTDADDEFACAS